MTHAPLRLGIDLGGTKTEIIALDGQSGAERFRKRLPTIRGDYQATLATIAALVHEAENHLGQTGSVGIGIPGAVSPNSGLVKNANSTWIIGKDLKGDLEKILHRPVRIANDADCFALSEAIDGAGAGFDLVFGVILGTGVGGGLVAHGRLLSGPNAITGEWGHNVLDPHGPQCYCGKQGCIETLLCGPALEQRLGMAPKDAATSDDPAVLAAFACYEEDLARALGGVINIFDPHVVILGGGVGNIGRLYQNVPQLWGKHIFSDVVSTRLLPPCYGDSSGVRGAAWLWPKD